MVGTNSSNQQMHWLHTTNDFPTYLVTVPVRFLFIAWHSIRAFYNECWNERMSKQIPSFHLKHFYKKQNSFDRCSTYAVHVHVHPCECECKEHVVIEFDIYFWRQRVVGWFEFKLHFMGIQALKIPKRWNEKSGIVSQFKEQAFCCHRHKNEQTNEPEPLTFRAFAHSMFSRCVPLLLFTNSLLGIVNYVLKSDDGNDSQIQAFRWKNNPVEKPDLVHIAECMLKLVQYDGIEEMEKVGRAMKKWTKNTIPKLKWINQKRNATENDKMNDCHQWFCR